jgi:hypothetical protein
LRNTEQLSERRIDKLKKTINKKVIVVVNAVIDGLKLPDKKGDSEA